MRDDMFKVIVERPRKGSRMRTRDGRMHRASEDVPTKIGMKQGYQSRKWLNENLSPLKRFLESQVNRPWDKVYSELCANIDRRNTVQEHIFAHIGNFVALNTRLVDGKVYTRERWAGSVLIEETGIPLFVHPVTRLLLRNRRRVTRRQARDAQRAVEREKIDSRWRKLNAAEQLHKIEGIWYLVTLAPMGDVSSPDPQCSANAVSYPAYPNHWDVVLKQLVSRASRPKRGPCQAHSLYGQANVYACRKRQLSAAELRQHKLTNENAGDSRRFFSQLIERFLIYDSFLTPPPPHPDPLPRSGGEGETPSPAWAGEG